MKTRLRSRLLLVAALVLAVSTWRVGTATAVYTDPQCEEDAVGAVGHLLPDCIPADIPPEGASTPLTCVEAEFCEATYDELASTYDQVALTQMDAEDTAILPQVMASMVEAVNGSSPSSSTRYAAWLSFYLYSESAHPSICSKGVVDNGYCGRLFHKYRIVDSDGNPGDTVYSTPFLARSGDNDPAHVGIEGGNGQQGGPIPDGPGTYSWGYDTGQWTHYESATDEPHDPGKWRLDPWHVGDRCCFEIHGGTGDHAYDVSRTEGCIRLRAAAITSLKSLWDNRTTNKKNHAPVGIYYP